MNETTMYGRLLVVATPIGNLGDMVPRGIEALQMADVIAAEDTRHSAKLLQHFNIDTPMLSYHDHGETQRAQLLIDKLLAGSTVALISDAGTPLIADPGYRLVAAARDAGVVVQAIPGACAFVTALCASGLPTDRFLFEGFLPAKGGARRKRLQSLADHGETLIFYESPHRIEACLVDMADAFTPERGAVVARELTKTFETFNTGSLGQLIECVQADANQQRGEMVVLVAGAEPVEAQISSEVERLMQLLVPRMPLKEAAAVGAEYFGLKKNQLYRWALENL